MAFRFLRSLAPVLLALALGGCNLVYSEKPLFTAADEAGAPRLREGVWLTDDPKCKVDESQPVQSWPECADWSLLRAGEIRELKKGAWQSTPYVLATGKPPVLQLPLSGEKGSIYLYGGLKPVRLDADGRVVEFSSWPVQCGPPPPDEECAKQFSEMAKKIGPGKPPASTAGPRRCVTHQPLPGLTVQDDNCIAQDPSAVRNAAGPSEAWDTTPTTAHWVRDAPPDASQLR